MTTKAEWLALAERCEKATGPDREINWDIHESTGGLVDRVWPEDWLEEKYQTPIYTASLDAITALIERELAGWDVSSARSQSHARANVWRLSPISRGSFPPKHTVAATEALARCAAFCRAMAEKAGE